VSDAGCSCCTLSSTGSILLFSFQVIMALLRHIGCTADLVPDGEQAVQAWFLRYDVIFMDVQARARR
jgi:hypothetical protein